MLVFWVLLCIVGGGGTDLSLFSLVGPQASTTFGAQVAAANALAA